MTANGFVQIALYCAVVILLVKPFGFYMTRVFNGERTFLSPLLRPVERVIYTLSRVNEHEEQSWIGYALAMLTFSLAGFVALYALQRLQAVLPFNPQHLDPVPPDLAFNTSVSFLTNTNWQSYTPETTMSYLTQMAGLTMHNFVSAATGIALAIALIRGFARRSAQTIGNFWVDLTRTVLYVLLPISIVVGLNGKSGMKDVVEGVSAIDFEPGDLVLVQAGDLIPSDGDVVEGVASIDESAITGESAPVIRESGGDRSAVTGGTRVLSDWIKVRITAAQGSTFLDRMIALVEGADRQKTPNEIALNILLAGLTLIFVFAVATIPSFANFAGGRVSVVVLVALFVTLIPTTIGALLSAIGISGMDRLVRFNVLAMSGRAVEAAGDVDTLLLDKTGTITLGNRQAAEFPLPGVSEKELADAAQLASLSDETPEGRSIVVLAKEKYGIRGRDMGELHAKFIPFSAHTRLSGIDTGTTAIRKGAVDAILTYVRSVVDASVTDNPGSLAAVRPSVSDAAVRALNLSADKVAKSGGTPLAVAKDGHLLGIIHLKDIIKGGIRERFSALRQMGIRTVMITGDNPLTAAAIAAEAGVDDFLAQATPETKLKLIRDEQAQGKLVAMCGDGTNDAPALAQADVGVAMNTGTMAAREAGNMVDLDSDPTKLIEIVEIGKQLLMTRGALTTFSIANDVAKYFAIIPAAFVVFYPQLQSLNIMHLATPQSAILSAIIFNALIIVALIPLSLRGVSYRPVGAASILRRNLLVYGLGGIIVPFIGIKLIDLVVGAIHLA